MNKYNPNIHHRRSIRLKGYDYSKEGLHFLTFCCQNREQIFNRVGVPVGAPLVGAQSHQIQLNDAGKMIEAEWLSLADRFPQRSFTRIRRHAESFSWYFGDYCRCGPYGHPKRFDSWKGRDGIRKWAPTRGCPNGK